MAATTTHTVGKVFASRRVTHVLQSLHDRETLRSQVLIRPWLLFGGAFFQAAFGKIHFKMLANTGSAKVSHQFRTWQYTVALELVFLAGQNTSCNLSGKWYVAVRGSVEHCCFTVDDAVVAAVECLALFSMRHQPQSCQWFRRLAYCSG